MQDSLKVENTPKRHCREPNVSGTTQVSFLVKFEELEDCLQLKNLT